MVDIKDIEQEYKYVFGVKKINKKTKKWKKFYRDTKSGKIGHLVGLDTPIKSKPKRVSSSSSISLGKTMIFNGRQYAKTHPGIPTKVKAKELAKDLNKKGVNAIIDHRKTGYFLWTNQRNKRGRSKK